MVKFATSLFFAALLAAPALAAPASASSQQYGRELEGDDVLVIRAALEDIYGRELIADLEERDPFGIGMIFKGLAKGIKALVHKFKHHKGKGKNHHDPTSSSNNNNNNNNQRRDLELEDLLDRSFEDDMLDELD